MVSEVPQMEWLEPWSAVIDEAMRAKLEGELAREVGRGHILFRRPARALARRYDQDDVLFAIGNPSQLAVVHLTWAAHPEGPAWPSTSLFDEMSGFAEERMKRDHDEYAG
jgi:hypothetical protein